MRCPNCNNEVPEGKRFCGYCGRRLALEGRPFDEDAPTRLAAPEVQEALAPAPRGLPPQELPAPSQPAELLCPACGTRNRASARFCDGCGARMVKPRQREAPEAVIAPAEAGRARVRAWISLLVMAAGWAIAWGAGWEIYNRYCWSICVEFQNHWITWSSEHAGTIVAGFVFFTAAGAISALVTALGLRLARPLRGKHIALIAGGWTAAWAIWCTWVYWSGDTWGTVTNFLLLIVVMLAGALITGAALRQVEPSLRGKQIVVITVLWGLAVFAGLTIGALIAPMLVPYSDFSEVCLYEPGQGAISGGVFGAIAGAAGFGIVHWQLNRARKSRAKDV